MNTRQSFQVSICKFKFTGGAKPTLEEKKMLRVDSGGNFCYSSGSGEKTMTGFEFMPREVIQANASIVTDRFTSITADRFGGGGGGSGNGGVARSGVAAAAAAGSRNGRIRLVL
jgi:hypothetical protein